MGSGSLKGYAQAHFAKYNKFVGSFGVAATFSFYQAKILNMGDAGAIIANDKNL